MVRLTISHGVTKAILSGNVQLAFAWTKIAKRDFFLSFFSSFHFLSFFVVLFCLPSSLWQQKGTLEKGIKKRFHFFPILTTGFSPLFRFYSTFVVLFKRKKMTARWVCVCVCLCQGDLLSCPTYVCLDVSCLVLSLVSFFSSKISFRPFFVAVEFEAVGTHNTTHTPAAAAATATAASGGGAPVSVPVVRGLLLTPATSHLAWRHNRVEWGGSCRVTPARHC